MSSDLLLAGEDRTPAVRLLAVRGLELAAGFLWEDSAPDPGPAAARRRARSVLPKADCYAAAGGRLGLARLAGLSPRPRRPLSLAALLISQQRQGIEVWTLRDREGQRFCWVWAARMGRLSAMADRCFETLDEALALTVRLREILGLDEPRVLDEVQSRMAVNRLACQSGVILKACRLRSARPLTLPRVLAGAFLGIALASMAGAGWFVWQDWQDEARLAASSQGRTQHELRVAEARAHPERHFDSRWLAQPSPKELLSARAPAMLAFPLAAGGWTLNELEATEQGLEAVWQASPAAALLKPPPGAQNDAKDVILARETKALPAVASREPRDWHILPSENQHSLALSDLASRFGLKLKVSWKPSETRTVDGERVSCPWRQGSFTLANVPSLLLEDWPSLALALDRPGLVLRQIRWKDRNWTLSGDIYAKR